MQITCLIHSYLRSPFPFSFLSPLFSYHSVRTHTHAHIYPQLTQAHDDSGFNVSIRSMYLGHFAFAIGRLYIMLVSLVSRSGFPVCSVALICTSYVYCIYIVDTVLHEIRFSSHISTLLCIHSHPLFSDRRSSPTLWFRNLRGLLCLAVILTRKPNKKLGALPCFTCEGRQFIHLFTVWCPRVSQVW